MLADRRLCALHSNPRSSIVGRRSMHSPRVSLSAACADTNRSGKSRRDRRLSASAEAHASISME
eukprot:3943348-Alexandrium_andersonii.AAC.1